jgi:MFS family permease
VTPSGGESIPQLSFKETLKIAPVRRLWIAQLVSIFGDYLALFGVLSTVTFELHANAFQVILVWIVFLLPVAIVSPVAGVYVDKWNVKATMVASDLTRGALIVILLFEHNLIAIYAILFAVSCISSFFVPAQTVAIRAITPTKALVAANGLMSQAQQLSQILAPAAMGLMIRGLGANACFGFDCFSFFFSASLVATLAIHRLRGAGAGEATVLESMKEGLAFIRSHSALTMVIVSMTAGMFAIRCFGSLLSIYVRDILRGDTEFYGVLNSLIGVGMIAGAQALPKLARRTSHPHLVSIGLSGMGLAVLLSALWPSGAPAIGAMLGVGFFAAFVMVSAQVMIQQETPHELLGRVTSTLMSMLAIAQVLALMGAGPVAERFGVIGLYYASAAALIAIGAVGYAKLRSTPQTSPHP